MASLDWEGLNEAIAGRKGTSIHDVRAEVDNLKG